MVDGLYSMQVRREGDYVLQFWFEMNGPTEVRIGYAE